MEERRHKNVRQLELLVEFLEQHKDLALGRMRSKEARAVAARLWRECTLILNAEGPARTSKEWPRVWNDLKCRVQTKLVNINASQQATGGGPSSTASLTPLEDRVASILGRDIGPLPNVRQIQFAIHQDDSIGVAEEIVQKDVVQDSEPIVVLDVERQNVEVVRPSVASLTPSLMGQVPSPLSSTQNERTNLATRRRKRGYTAATQSTARPPPAQFSANRSALEESRSTILKIESLRAEAALINAQATKSFADGLNILAESVDRFTRVYTQQAGTSGAPDD